MDTVTHILTGVVLSEATFRRRIGRSANWLAALAALTPDLDVLAHYINPDPWVALEYHRGLTHSLFLSPILAFLWAGLFWLFRRKQFGAMYLLALLAVVSHPLLDLATSYGTLLFWPVTNHRYAVDLLPIVDIIFTPILLATMAACWLVRRISRRRARRAGQIAGDDSLAAWQGVPQPGGAARRVAWVGLLLAAAYVGVGAWADGRAIAVARATVPADHGPIQQVRAGPLIGATFARRVVVETGQGFYVARYNVLHPDERPRWAWAADSTGRYVEEANRLPRIELFRWFSMGLARPVVDRADGDGGRPLVRVTYFDMRYGYPADSTESIFWAYVILDAKSGQVLDGPISSGWGGHEGSPEGLAAHFRPPANHVDLSHRRGRQIRTIWNEAWK